MKDLEKSSKEYVCEYCGKTFKSGQHKAGHVRWCTSKLELEDPLRDYLNKARDEMDKKLKEVFAVESSPRVRSILENSVSGGKRFRSGLSLLVADNLSIDRDLAKEYALLVELIHCASLVHDDIVDEDSERRGRASTWRATKSMISEKSRFFEGLFYRLIAALPFKERFVLFDPYKVAVLVGDSIFSLAQKIIKDPKVLDIASNSVHSLAKGAMKEVLETVSNPDDYRELVKGKTAALFALAFHLPAIHYGSPEIEEICRKAGRRLGEVYQFVDDLVGKDVPKGIKVNELITESANDYRKLVVQLPENQYRDLLLKCVTYMANKRLEQGGSKYYLTWNPDKEGYFINRLGKYIKVGE